MQKRVITLLVVLVAVSLYSILTLNMGTDSNRSLDISYANEARLNEPKNTGRVPQPSVSKNTQPSVATMSQNLSPKQNDPQSLLPIKLTLLGVRVDRVNAYNSIALIQNPDGVEELVQADSVANTAITLKTINETSVTLEYENALVELALTPPNLLSRDYRAKEKTYAEMLEMDAKEIGSRPRIIEHIVTLTPTPFIADGKIAGEGINPALFKQAGLQKDDVIKTINGKSVTIDSEFEEVKREIMHASSLKFEVMRKGRLITLYLDIPSEGLKVNI